ncbi:MAG TPA: hypothetical protein VFK45_03975, partial [Gammaproteobacteria bacterium]|nr:hypothetical protein [Gammaproteobacteria bacterium]
WMWKFEHPNGAREIDTLHIPIERAIDVIAKHGFPPRPPRPERARPQVPLYPTGTANAGGGPP